MVMCFSTGASNVCARNETCCPGLGCVQGREGVCCGPNFYYMLEKFTEYCGKGLICCSNSISAKCCPESKVCCSNADSIDCCNKPIPDGSSRWWLWFSFSLMMLSFILIIISNCLEETSPLYRQARRFNDWYRERSRNGETDEEMMAISAGRYNPHPNTHTPNPPLYQTVVPPTYHYQKPPTPAEPPPKYEESFSEPQNVSLTQQLLGYQHQPDYQTISPSTRSDPSRSRRNRNTPLVKTIEDRQILTNGHNLFIRPSSREADASPLSRTQDSHRDDRQTAGRGTDSDEEEVIFELNTNPVMSSDVR